MKQKEILCAYITFSNYYYHVVCSLIFWRHQKLLIKVWYIIIILGSCMFAKFTIAKMIS